MKYGQAIFEAADTLDTSPGSADTLRYLADLAEDRARSRGALDAVYSAVRRDPGVGEQLCRHARKGRVPEHHRRPAGSCRPMV